MRALEAWLCYIGILFVLCMQSIGCKGVTNVCNTDNINAIDVRYARLYNDTINNPHTPRALAHLERGHINYWVVADCPYQYTHYCKDGKHRYYAGQGTEDPNRYLGLNRAWCGHGNIIVISEGGLAYLARKLHNGEYHE